MNNQSILVKQSLNNLINQSDVVNKMSIEKKNQLLGALTILLLQSPLHNNYFIQDLEERFLPSIIHNQFRYYELQGQAIGFCNWAWLTDEVQAKFQTGDYVLQLDEWVGGKNLWFLEFIAPFGHARSIVKDLRTNIFTKGTPVQALRVGNDGSLKSIAKYCV